METTAVEVTPTVELAPLAAPIDQTVENTVTDDEEESLKCGSAGSRVEGIKTVDGKIRPISKVEGSVITNEVKLVAELAEKVGQLEVTDATETKTAADDEDEVEVKETVEETTDITPAPTPPQPDAIAMEENVAPVEEDIIRAEDVAEVETLP